MIRRKCRQTDSGNIPIKCWFIGCWFASWFNIKATSSSLIIVPALAQRCQAFCWWGFPRQTAGATWSVSTSGAVSYLKCGPAVVTCLTAAMDPDCPSSTTPLFPAGSHGRLPSRTGVVGQKTGGDRCRGGPGVGRARVSAAASPFSCTALPLSSSPWCRPSADVPRRRLACGPAATCKMHRNSLKTLNFSGPVNTYHNQNNTLHTHNNRGGGGKLFIGLTRLRRDRLLAASGMLQSRPGGGDRAVSPCRDSNPRPGRRRAGVGDAGPPPTRRGAAG